MSSPSPGSSPCIASVGTSRAGRCSTGRREPKDAGALLTGDIVMVVPDRTVVSFMWSYPNLLPLPTAEVTRIAAALQPLAFDRIHGAWWDPRDSHRRRGRRAAGRGTVRARSDSSLSGSRGDELLARDHGRVRAERRPEPFERAGARLAHVDPPRRAELGERDQGKLGRRVRVDADRRPLAASRRRAALTSAFGRR